MHYYHDIQFNLLILQQLMRHKDFKYQHENTLSGSLTRKKQQVTRCLKTVNVL